MRNLGVVSLAVMWLIPGEARGEGCPQDCAAEEMDNEGCCPEPPPPGKYGYGMVKIQPGSFMMGSLPSEEGRGDDETRHSVTLTRGFWMGKTEVTQGFYEQVMGSNPSHFSSCGIACPVESVSWYDAVAFANKLSELEGLEKCYEISGESVSWPMGLVCTGYRLPTEAEWEYAAKAGTNTIYAGSNVVGEVAWYSENSEYKTHAVAQKSPNAWGLYDMSGNVWEWCWDWYGDYNGSSTDPIGSSSASVRVYRGGSGNEYPVNVRFGNRSGSAPSYRFNGLGFRLVRSIP